MAKKRVYELAKELNMSSKDLLAKTKEMGLEFKSHMASMEDSEIDKVKSNLSGESTKDAKNDDKSQNSNKKHMNNKQSNNKQKNTNNQNNKSDKKENNAGNKQNQQNNNQKPANNQGTKPKNVRTTNEQDKIELKKQQQQQQQNRRNKRRRGTHGGPGKKKGKNNNNQPKQVPTPRKERPLPESVEYTEGMTVAEIAKKLHKEPAELVKKLFMMGVMANQNQSLDSDSIELLLAEYNVEAIEKIQVDPTDFDTYFDQEPIEENLELRPSVVTIMGHVDHGKTTLLDTLRETSVTSGEAGGITQHIGAYQVVEDGKTITFLDTPGHAAFTTMRARGADVTDIAIIVVAADDGVKPQTVEAINHAKAAEVPIIIAVNKVDKPEANPQRVMQELTEHGLIAEAWGGDTIFVEISAKFGQNLDELLEMVLLVAEVEDLKADPTLNAIGSVIEARLDKSKGPIATLLVQNGTLKQGDAIVVGNTHGRIRTMTSDSGQRIEEAAPSTPVEITGLNEAPQAGDRFVVFDDEKTSRQIGEARATAANEAQRTSKSKVTLETLFESLEEGELKEVNVIIKADVQGSVEALSSSIQKIEVEGVKVKIVHTGVGAINESDVTLASASGAIVIGFNVRPTPQAKDNAAQEEIEIRAYNVIYDAIDDIESAMKGMLDPEFKEEVTGNATVRETYTVSKVGTIAGSYVNDGVVKRSSSVRIIRDGVVIHDGELASLKRFQDDAKEVRTGYECGIMVENYNDIKVDDVIEAYEMVEIERK